MSFEIVLWTVIKRLLVDVVILLFLFLKKADCNDPKIYILLYCYYHHIKTGKWFITKTYIYTWNQSNFKLIWQRQEDF